jgi:hypothetical protein
MLDTEEIETDESSRGGGGGAFVFKHAIAVANTLIDIRIRRNRSIWLSEQDEKGTKEDMS